MKFKVGESPSFFMQNLEKTMKKTVIKIDEEKYPYLLKQIDNPPKQIYVYGNPINLNQKMVTVVGTCNPSFQGKREAIKIVKELIKRGYCIVTSITKGIDEIVFKEVLENNGKVIVSIPWGIRDIRNRKYLNKFKHILENNGNIITEFDFYEGIVSKKYTDLNRVLCGLSKSLIIIEAGMTSGTIITAQYSLEQNRDIYAVLGNLKSPKKVGTNFLIKQGAKPIISAVL